MTFTKKITINTALGFDTYLVMRHGVRNTTSEAEDKGKGKEKASSLSESPKELGCYFCNDVVAPTDVRLFPNFPD